MPSALTGLPDRSADPAIAAIQDELADLNKRLVLGDLRIPPEHERSPSPEPIYDRCCGACREHPPRTAHCPNNVLAFPRLWVAGATAWATVTSRTVWGRCRHQSEIFVTAVILDPYPLLERVAPHLLRRAAVPDRSRSCVCIPGRSGRASAGMPAGSCQER